MKHFFTPEDVVRIQADLGSDIMMPLDECVHYPCAKDHAEVAMRKTVDWAKRSKAAFSSLPLASSKEQFLFGIVQGATYEDLRKECASELLDLDFDGYSIGGVSVGEPSNLIYNTIELVNPLLPADHPRYLMGVGLPEDLLEANQLVLQELQPYNHGSIEKGATLSNNVAIGEGTTVRSRTTIRGPAIIGDQCEIGPNTSIGPYTSVGNNVIVRNCELENSIIMEETHIDCARRITDSVIGRKVTISGSETSAPKGHKLILGDMSFVAL
jgi:NDP-sugar pyrophosphorylase family protein